jgi:hypothetical protein
MTALFQQLRGVAPLHPQVSPAVMTEAVPFTIAAVSAENNRLHRLYEFSGAQPSAKYGDFFEKIRGQIAPVLETQGIVPSTENIEAAESLIKNGLPLTPDNLAEVKLINGKVNEIYDRLNPLVAADMIKNGLNPAEMAVDDVLSYIDAYGAANGGNTIEKIAKCIRRMEAQKELSEEERASVLAIYKMLNHIKKSGAAALGLHAEAGGENNVTLGQLLTASKNARQARRAGTDKTVSDAEGLAQTAQNHAHTVKDILNRTKTQAYADYQIKRLGDQQNADALIRFVRENGNFTDMRAETALQKLRQAAAENNTVEGSLNFEAPQQTVRFMLDNNIPVTLDNLDAVKKYLSDKKSFSKSVNQLRAVLDKKGIGAALENELPSADRLKEGLNSTGFGESFMAALEEIADEADDIEVIEQIDLVRKTAGVLQMRRQKADGRNMPLCFNGSVTEIDLYVVNPRLNETDPTDIFMSLDAGTLGEVQLLLNAAEDRVRLTVTAEDDAALARLKENEPVLKTLLKEAGYDLAEIKYKPQRTGSAAIEFPAERQGGRIYETV